MLDVEDIERKCSFCKVVKPLREFNKNSRAKYGYSHTCKKCRRMLYLRRKEEVLAQGKIYRSKNVEKISLQKKDYLKRNKSKVHLVSLTNSSKNCFVCNTLKPLSEFGIDRTRADGRRHICKTCTPLYSVESYNRNKPHKQAYARRRMHEDLSYRLRQQLRSRHLVAIAGGYKVGSAVRDLGCSVEDLRERLQLRFYRHPVLGIDMSWEMWGCGIGKWHIDHIRPLSSFDLSDPEQCAKAFHFSNLQPLWWDENIRKSNKIPA